MRRTLCPPFIIEIIRSCVPAWSDLLVLGDQQTSDRSFCYCPIFGGVADFEGVEAGRATLEGVPLLTFALGFQTLGAKGLVRSQPLETHLHAQLPAGMGLAVDPIRQDLG